MPVVAPHISISQPSTFLLSTRSRRQSDPNPVIMGRWCPHALLTSPGFDVERHQWSSTLQQRMLRCRLYNFLAGDQRRVFALYCC